MFYDVEDLLNAHGIKYFKRGNTIKCICPNPSHNDKHVGSFSFDKVKNLGYCFACGYSCNIYSLNKQLGEHCDYKNYNYEFDKSLKPNKEEKKVYSIPVVYGKLYDPKYNNEVMNFLHGIGWSNEFIEEKGVKYCRYAEMIGNDLANNPNEKPTVMENRICIPIYKENKLINYECRSFNGSVPKVKYVKSCSANSLYNYDSIDLNNEVLLVEGIKSVGKAYSLTKNVISSFGNQLTEIKIGMLNKIPKLKVFLDYDAGGLTFAKKLKDNYTGELRATFCPQKYKNSDGQLKGKDLNDCDLKQINYYLNHTMSIDKAIQKLSNDDSDEIFWL